MTLPEAMRAADLVVSATGAAGIVIGARPWPARWPHATDARSCSLDLAVPRDVEPETAYVERRHA